MNKIQTFLLNLVFPTNHRWIKIYILIFAFSFFSFLFSKFIGYFSFITSPSVNARYVFVYKLKNNFKKNDLIVFKFKGSSYYEKDFPMVKYVKCLPGEYLQVKGLDFYCNGEFIGTAKTKDSKGFPVEPFVYNDVIPDNHYFVMGIHKDSYDSRYWGFVEKESVIGKAYKIF